MSAFEISGATDIGKVRRKNEDSFVVCNRNVSLAVVADGIGGHSHGEIASMLCCRGMAEYFTSAEEITSVQEAADLLTQWGKKVNSSIFERNKKERNPRPMGTTLCAAIFLDNEIVSANAGDSRLYMLKDDKLQQLTRDHIVKQNGIQMLYRAVGISHELKLDIKILPAEADRYILVSDGIYNSIDEKTIADILASEAAAEDIVKALITSANDNGGIDNLTAVAAIRRS